MIQYTPKHSRIFDTCFGYHFYHFLNISHFRPYFFVKFFEFIRACLCLLWYNKKKKEVFIMYVNITGSINNKDVYIYQSFRKENGKTSSRIYKKLGKYNELLKQFNNDEEKLMAWAKEEAKKETENYKNQSTPIALNLSTKAVIEKNEERCFNVGYLFLQQICAELRIDSICRKIKARHKFKYDINAIMTDLVFARILSPASKLSSYSFCHKLLEPPKYSLQNVYRALSVLAEESFFIQNELYRNSNFIQHRNKKILYYDCSNFYFEIEEEDGNKCYGKSKENRPNPIVTMGLFMDADGVPLAFDIFPGNQNEQTTLKPLETTIIRDFGCSEFVFCSDAGLGSLNNRRFNSFGNRAYVITHSIKKMKKEDKAIALSPTQFKKIGSSKFIDIRTLDETDETVYNSIYYKEIPIVSSDMDETIIVTYSPKYKAYQQKIRSRQLDRAQKIVEGKIKKRKGKTQNDPTRFVKETKCTSDGEIAEKTIYELDQNRIAEEAKYDGFYAVITNLEDNVEEILKINKQRWEIEENFRIMKTDFEARPVYVRRDDRIKAHFLTCYISLLVYRLLEKKLDNQYTCEKILETIRNMQMSLLSGNSGYIPSYKRTDLTDALHNTFGFRTDYEFITKATMRNIIKNTKKSTESKK